MSQSAGRKSVTLRLPPAWLVFQFAIVGLAAGLVVADRYYWHWYAPDRDIQSATTEDLDRLAARVSKVESDVVRAQTTASSAESAARSNGSSGLVDNVESSLARMASSLAIISLVQSKGGAQSSASAQGKACIAWLLKGEGSGADCGFTRADP
ncbi:MAG: hypothetical protein WBO97_09300 [Tepidiformaceae bacterium]